MLQHLTLEVHTGMHEAVQQQLNDTREIVTRAFL